MQLLRGAPPTSAAWHWRRTCSISCCLARLSRSWLGELGGLLLPLVLGASPACVVERCVEGGGGGWMGVHAEDGMGVHAEDGSPCGPLCPSAHLIRARGAPALRQRSADGRAMPVQ